jgi:UDP-3-O-[3-hydroxymyristoyl] glucosamine N-acyltransferase
MSSSGNGVTASSGGYPLSELAELTGARLSGAGDVTIREVDSLDAAGPAAISFLANPRYRSQLATTTAGAVIVDAEGLASAPAGMSCLVSDNPYLTFARVARYLHPVSGPPAGIASTASVAPSARLGRDVHVGAGAVIGARCELGDGVVVGANSVVEEGVTIGARTRLMPQVYIGWGCSVGCDTVLHAGCVIGADGFGFAPGDHGWEKVPQIGCVVIGDSVEIGANSCVDRASMGRTVIESGVKLDNFVQIGHNVTVGSGSVMAAKSGVSGSTVVGSGCRIAGGVGIGGHLTIAPGTVITAMSMITHDIPEAGTYSSGTPMSPTRDWRRNAVRFNQLERMARRLQTLERRLDDALNNNKGES